MTVVTNDAGAAAVMKPETKRFTGSFCLQRKGGGKARVRHATFERAEHEAHRLLGKHPEATLVILQEVARVKLRSVDQADG